MSPSTSAPLLRERDLLVFLLVLIGLYLSLDSNDLNYRIEASWFVDLRTEEGSSSLVTKLPAPVIANIDGNRKKQVVLVTADYKLNIMDASVPIQKSSSIYTPSIIASTQLPKGDIIVGKHPVLIKTGYITPYSSKEHRSQVVVVVTEDGSISLFDASLKLLWESQINVGGFMSLPGIREKFIVNDLAVSILPLSLESASSGVVIVGASLILRAGEDFFEIENGFDLNENGEKEHPEMKAKRRLGHFNIVALGSSSGSVIWKHDGLDVRAEQYSKSLSLFSSKLNKVDLITQVHRAPEAPDWTVFRDSLIAELPHDWHSKDDSSIRIAHFSRKHIGAGAVNQAQRPSSSGRNKQKKGFLKTIGKFTGLESAPLSQSASLPHDAAEHLEHPNVLVAHTRRGLEVVSLKAGAPIAAMALTQGLTYADVDGDGIVDSILVVESSESLVGNVQLFVEDMSQVKHCTMFVLSGLPPRAQLFNGSICEARINMKDSLMNQRSKKNNPEVSAASPLILQARDTVSSTKSKSKIIVIAINIGIVTAYSGNGDFLWQHNEAPKWNIDNKIPCIVLFDVDANRVDDLGKHDNEHASILVTGEDTMTILSRSGEVFASAYLPKLPIGRPSMGDFDNDGISDIIISTADAYLGYRVEASPSPKGFFIALIILLAGAVAIFVLSLRSDFIIVDGIKQINSNKRTYSILRSTDEAHLD